MRDAQENGSLAFMNFFKGAELRNNKNVNNYECLLKRMLYCAGNGQEFVICIGCHFGMPRF